MMVISTMEKNRTDKKDRVYWRWTVKFYRLLGTDPKEVRATPMDTWKKGIQIDESSSTKTLQELTGQV